MHGNTNAFAISAQPQQFVDYCDACPARAQFRLSLPFGELDFCNHHFHANKGRLLDLAGQIISAPDGYLIEPDPLPQGQWSQLELPFGDEVEKGR